MSEYQKIPELYDYDAKKVESYSTPKYPKKDLASMLLYQGLNLADWRQTSRIVRDNKTHGNENSGKVPYFERNFPNGSAELIGKHPSQTEVDIIHLVKALGQPYITNKLSEPYKSIFQALTVGMAGNTVKNNLQIGLKAYKW